jgi:hypothetical protein
MHSIATASPGYFEDVMKNVINFGRHSHHLDEHSVAAVEEPALGLESCGSISKRKHHSTVGARPQGKTSLDDAFDQKYPPGRANKSLCAPS